MKNPYEISHAEYGWCWLGLSGFIAGLGFHYCVETILTKCLTINFVFTIIYGNSFVVDGQAMVRIYPLQVCGLFVPIVSYSNSYLSKTTHMVSQFFWHFGYPKFMGIFADIALVCQNSMKDLWTLN